MTNVKIFGKINYKEMRGADTMNKQINKKTGEELQAYLAFRKRGSRVESRKGKGSFKRHQKHKGREEN